MTDPSAVSPEWQDRAVIQRMLRNARRIAVVGLSPNPLRASNFVGYYLKRHGYDMLPVNPRETEILGAESAGDLQALKGPIDIVNVFRDPSALPPIVDQAIEIGARGLWLQFGVIDEVSAQRARDAGMDVVMDKCIKVEHARYFGRMHWLGFNTGQVRATRG